MRLKYLIVLSLLFLGACVFTADGPYWLNGKPMNTPCWMDSGCREAEQKEREAAKDCRTQEGKLYGWINGHMQCLTAKEIETEKKSSIDAGLICSDIKIDQDWDFNVFCHFRHYDE